MAARTIAIEDGHPNVTEDSFAISLSTHGLMAQIVGRGLTGQVRRDTMRLAARRYQQALAIDLRLDGRQSREVGTHLNNLAELRAFQGRWGTAQRLHGRALALGHVALPPGDPDLAQSLSNLGSTLLTSGRARQGYRAHAVLDLLTEALAIHEDAFDRLDHPDRVNTSRWLASARWTVDALGGPVLGQVAPDPARAQALCAAYNLDPEEQMAMAQFFAERARL